MPKDQERTLPSLLKYYENSDFELRQRVLFIFYLGVSSIVALVLIIFSTSFVQLLGDNFQGLYLPVIIIELIITVLFTCTLYLLFLGWYNLASHLLIIFAFTGIWFVMWVDKSGSIIRLDTVVLIVAVLSMTPLLIKKYKITIILYLLANILMLFIFISVFKKSLNISDASALDYFIDTSIAIIFTGIAGYNIFRINKRSIERAISDIKERKVAENALAKSEKNFSELTDLLPQTVFETDLSGNLTYINKNGLDSFGYSHEDFEKGVNVLHTIAPEDRAIGAKNIKGLINGEPIKGNQYTAVRKDGTTFPIQIYSSVIVDNNRPIGLRGIIIDITERKNAEKEIKKGKEQFESLVSNIPGITYRCLNDKDWTMLFVSSEIDKISGYPATDFIHNKIRTFGSIIHKDDQKSSASRVTDAIKKSQPWEIEYRIQHHDGSIRWVYEKGRAVSNIEGEIEYLDGFILDVTERKIAQTALVESEKKYRTLLDNMNEAVIMVDNDDRIKYINKKFTEIIGYTPDEIVGKIGYEVLIDPKDHEIIKDANIKRKENIVGQYEMAFYAKDGHKIDFLISGAPITNSNGVTIGSIGAMIDITERKKAEQALKESEELFKSLIELAPNSIVLSDFDGRYIMVNKAFTKDTGVSSEEAVGKTPNELGIELPDDDTNRIRSELSSIGIVENIETSLTNRNGKKVDLYYSSRVINLNDKPVILSSTIDITQKKITEKELENHRNHLKLLVQERTEELEAANEELTATNDELFYQHKELEDALKSLQNAQEQLVQSKKMASLGVLASGVAHEINNPLNFINGGIHGIENYFKDNLSEHLDEINPLIEAVNLGVSRASDIVKSLNRFSRQTDSTSEKCDLNTIINNCIVILNNEVKNRIEIRKQLCETPYKVLGNDGKLHQAILNILTNAIQAIDSKGVITIETKIKEQTVFLSIHDTGHGIESNIINKIFDPFFTTKEPGKGTGLGLSICYQIVTEINGNIEVQSDTENGTKIIISLPID